MTPEPSWTFALLPRSGKTAWRRGRLPSSWHPERRPRANHKQRLYVDPGMPIQSTRIFAALITPRHFVVSSRM